MRKLFYLITCLTLIQLFVVSCDDYIETGVEGQWQLHKTVDENGKEQVVDTIYYSFKKNVFRYLKLLSDVEGDTFTCFGNYHKDGSRLIVDSIIPTTFSPWQCYDCLDWDELYKEFTIEKHKGNKLELTSGGILYVFRKQKKKKKTITDL